MTDLPLTVILSHGHIDHIGGSVYFDEVFMRQEERSVFVEYSDEIVTGWMKDMCGKELPEDYKYDCRGWVQIKDLEMGSFDLGDLPCEIISLQGHTIGSVGIYLPTLRLLLSGDALTPVMCMNFTNHMGLEELAATIRMVQNMENDRAKHNILPLSKFCLMQITRQRVRPAIDMPVEEACPTCFGKGKVRSSILFTEAIESKIDRLVNTIGIKKFKLYLHPYVAAYINKGLPSLYRKWQFKYGFGIRIVPDQSLAYLEYRFVDSDGKELEMKEESEMM